MNSDDPVPSGRSGTGLKIAIAVFWPSFLVAGVFTGIFFAFVDPWVLTEEIGLDSSSRLVGYSAAFLFAWLAGIITAVLSIRILRTPAPGSGSVPPPADS